MLPSVLFQRVWVVLCLMGLSAGTAAADEVLRYHDGARWVEVALAQGEIAAYAPEGNAKILKDAAEAVPGALVLPGSTETLRYLRLPGSKSSATLEAAAESLRKAGWEPRAVLYPPEVEERLPEVRQVLEYRLSVQLREGVRLAAILDRVDASVEREITYSPRTYILRVNTPELLGALKAANALYESGDVVFATPLIRKQGAEKLIPSDGLFHTQWNLRNTGQKPGSVPGFDIAITPAWDKANGSGVVIAI
ncbi:MAG: hypothetical protein IT368_01090, partial [Candidatus Hydrogenedentes bacterium]|nr:hypothetical protein [Candidatus Hydrogenedentota bacterium]